MRKWILSKIFVWAGKRLAAIKRAEIARAHKEMDERYDMEFRGYFRER